MNGSPLYFASSLLLLLLATLLITPAGAQSQPPTRVEPTSPYMITGLPELGRMYGANTKRPDWENFGRRIMPLGDISGDGINDFAISHRRSDTSGVPYGYPSAIIPEEVLIYHGVRGGLPAVKSAQIIRPTELTTITSLLCAGDFDGDGYADLATRIRLWGDTSYGNRPLGKEISRLVIFWNDGSGRYSLSDTTQLECDAQMWVGIISGIGHDFNGDSVDDLFIYNGSGFSNGELVIQASLRIYRGQRGVRWGRDGRIRRAEWLMWNLPPVNAMTTLDHDCDGVRDIIFYGNSSSSTVPAYVSVLYGRAGQFPDTMDLQILKLDSANGRRVLFSDVTGDGSQELILNSGLDQVIRIYAGRPGQRLLEQYGAGIEPPQPGHGWWTRPWAEIWSPHRLHDGWKGSYTEPLYKLGDGNGDGIEEIWTVSWPWIIGYAGGERMDSLIDVRIHFPGSDIESIASLGDIDGSGVETVALGYNNYPQDAANPFPGAVVFYKPDPTLIIAGRLRDLPHIEGEQCGAVAATVPAATGSAALLWLRAVPNPASGRLMVRWDDRLAIGTAQLQLSDQRGAVVTTATVDLSKRTATIDISRIAPGAYLLTLSTPDTTATLRLITR